MHSVKGNALVLVVSEPLFAIPHTMFSGYVTLYMLELGVTKPQVGMITSLGLFVHLFFALISAYVTDKYGRRYTTLIFDTVGWCGSFFLWAIAQNIYYFIAAAIMNAFFRIVMNSFHCLMLEDSPVESRIHIFNFMQVASILAGFFAPLGALLINRMTLVPAMRGMLMFTTIWMGLLFIVRHFFVKETAVGRQKIQEMKGVRLIDVFKAYIPVLRRMFQNKLLIIALLIRSLNFIQFTIRGTFLAVLVTERLGFPSEIMALFYTINAVMMLLVLVFVTPVLAQITRRWPISLGICFHISATLVLLLSPPTQNFFLLIAAAVLIALGTSITAPRIDTLVANTIVNEDRSVANAVINVILLLLSTPFGFIGGILADIDPRLPFILTFMVFIVCLLLMFYAERVDKKLAAEAG